MSRPWGESTLTAEERLRRYNQEASLFISEDSANEDEVYEVGSASKVPRYRPTTRKRQRTSSAIVSMGSALPSPVMSPLSRPQPPVSIKSEAETQALAELQRKPSNERVKIYVGKNNVICEVGLEDLEKSPVLKSLVNKTGTEHPFIMHPELTKVSAEHFRSVREFLLTDEYMPAIVDSPQGSKPLPKQLDGCTSVEHYQIEALRGAHLYVTAKRLGMGTMQDLVFRKITQAQYQSYGIRCLLEVAMVVFSRPAEGEFTGKGKFKSLGDNDKDDGDGDVLEQWLIESLGAKFQPMMLKHAQLFFRVANHGACAKRGFEVRVLRRKVETWEAMGSDVIAIEDDG